VPRRAAADALELGRCMFAHFGDCSDAIAPFGLRGPDDVDSVLICSRHLRDLRRLRPYERERLARYLRLRFDRNLTPLKKASAVSDTSYSNISFDTRPSAAARRNGGLTTELTDQSMPFGAIKCVLGDLDRPSRTCKHPIRDA
jgi:hypothetical protein